MQGSNNMQYSHLALMNGVTQNTRLQAPGASRNDSAQRVQLATRALHGANDGLHPRYPNCSLFPPLL
ncbi:unnamed protein product [Chondrus crispus]|uniref:Uncharacterized protein n=1 Tax=Chondrus crispus TaxID=2769 RepID=R7QLT6_CHOCR|nr:unnamed protein product [Chondrus crispus]CDF38355.1 unnamed protein product [Chondrus crispus]|eukprot:XP_005718240.1 unnamed protein product [Chondrus crispus]